MMKIITKLSSLPWFHEFIIYFFIKNDSKVRKYVHVHVDLSYMYMYILCILISIN